MLVTDSSILDGVVHDLVRRHLLLLDTSNLMIDFKRFHLGLEFHLKHAIQSYWEESMRVAGTDVASDLSA
jgi:hypothetical protein